MKRAKEQVRTFWEEIPCGDVYATGHSSRDRLENQAAMRYHLEPYIHPFARFEEGRSLDVLEVGVGMGADHAEWARSGPSRLVGIDITRRALTATRNRLEGHGLKSKLLVADAENLPFPDEAFDLVYSWGVIHHTPNTPAAIREIHRVLRRGGTARLMIYHRYSLVGAMLWLRYGLGRGKFSRPLTDIYTEHLESPGTQAFTIDEARAMTSMFADTATRVQLTFGDLLQGAVGQRHQGRLLTLAKRVWPRWLIRRVLGRFGLALLIEAKKSP